MSKIIHRTIKILTVFAIMQVIFAIVNISQAGFWDDILNNGKSFLQHGEVMTFSEDRREEEAAEKNVTIPIITDTASVREIISYIYNLLFILGVAITVVVGMILGIKFMTSSVEGKAKVKELLTPYIIGCVVVYGSYAIWRIAIIILGPINRY